MVHAIGVGDVAGTPLRVDEVHRLAPVAATAETVAAAVDALSADALLERHGPFLTLPGRRELLAIRQRRRDASARIWPEALRYARLVARLPFVRMVAIAGPVAGAVADDGADIALAIVAAEGRVWTARAAAALVGLVAQLHGVTLRLDPVLATSDLELDERSYAAALWLVELAPVAGFDVHRELLARNAWFADLLPNADPLLVPSAEGPPRRARRVTEQLLRRTPFDAIERWEMGRAVRRLARSAARGARYDADRCHTAGDSGRGRTLDAVARRLAELPDPG